MKRAFTLIELLVSFSVLAVISGGALVYLNKYNSRQSLNRKTDEVINYLKLAQSFAKTKQFPVGAVGTDLRFVEVSVGTDGKIRALANADADATFYNDLICQSNVVGVGISPATFYFWGGNGFLAHNNSGDIFESDEIAEVYVQSMNDVTGYNLLQINSLGQVVSNTYVSGQAKVNSCP